MHTLVQHTMKTIEQLEAEAKKAKQDAEDAGGTDANLNQLQKEAEETYELAKKDADLLNELNKGGAEPKTEKEKAKYTVDQIFIRHPDLKSEMVPKPVDDGSAANIEAKLLRNQVEGIIRQSCKTEEEIKVKMHYYDNKIVKTGNIHEDADNAIWLANKGRTKNAIEEMRRNPGEFGGTGGSGHKPNLDGAPELSATEIRKLVSAGLKQISPTRWEGQKTILEWDKNAKAWNQTFK